MTEKITEKNLIEQLRLAFPELEDSLQARLDAHKAEGITPSNYEIVGFVFKPKLKKEELSRGELTEFLRRGALFIERVCHSGDPEAINVVWIKLFEWLLTRPKELELIWPALGPATKENIKDAAQRWSDAGRYFGNTKNLPTSNLPKE
ncbi:MAG: hypothetical protein JWN74_1187 [Acidobacteriaceae bacterium]|nr:hypothetical protein [Acidobacteriaceae bacterium]